MCVCVCVVGVLLVSATDIKGGMVGEREKKRARGRKREKEGGGREINLFFK